MSNSYTPAATLFGRRIRITYVAVLVLLFIARMWTVHGVHEFFGLDAGHGEMVSIAGRLPGQSTEVMHAAFVRVYAPQTATDDSVDRAIGIWIAQNAKVAQLLARVCAGEDALCLRFHTLEAQMLIVAASARAAAQAAPAGRTVALGRLTVLQDKYLTVANAWVEELAAGFTTETKAQQHMLLLWAIAQVLATALIVAVIVEPIIRRLQRERSDVDRTAEEQSRLVAIVERAGNAVVISDPKGLIEWVNQGFVNLTGYPICAVAGRQMDEVLGNDQSDLAARAALRTAIDTGSSCARSNY